MKLLCNVGPLLDEFAWALQTISVNIAIQMLYPEHLIGSLKEEILHLQVSLVVIRWKKCANVKLDDNTLGQLLRAKETKQKPKGFLQGPRYSVLSPTPAVGTSRSLRQEFYSGISCILTKTRAGYVYKQL